MKSKERNYLIDNKWIQFKAKFDFFYQILKILEYQYHV